MDFRDVVAAKRDGAALSEEDIRAFVLAFARGEIPEYLAAAFLMAVFIRGMDSKETLALTSAMVATMTRRTSVRGPSSTGTGISTAPYGAVSQRLRSRSWQASQSPPTVDTTHPFQRTPSTRG